MERDLTEPRQVAPNVPRRGPRSALGGIARLLSEYAPSIPPWRIMGLALLVTAVAGSSVALATGWGSGELRYVQTEPAAAPTRAVSPTIAVLVASPLPPSKTETPPPTRAVSAVLPVATAPTSVPQVVSAPTAPTATAQPTPVFATAAPTAEPTAADVWQATLPQLDAAWGVDTPRIIALISAFRERFPDYPPAKEKLYAALLTYGGELSRQGDPSGAAATFAQAAALFPERAEAARALTRLTPTPPPPPVPLPPPPPVRTLVPLRRPTPPVAPPALAVPPPAPAAPANPTKAPFVPPR